jgi:hypothetical protein
MPVGGLQEPSVPEPKAPKLEKPQEAKIIPTKLSDRAYRSVCASLPPNIAKPENNAESLKSYYPLFNLVLSDEAALAKLREFFPVEFTEVWDRQSAYQQAAECLKAFSSAGFKTQALRYRLPIILSESPVHCREINEKIAAFNELIKQHYHQADTKITDQQLHTALKELLAALTEKGQLCTLDTLWSLLTALSQYFSIDDLAKNFPYLYHPPAVHAHQVGVKAEKARKPQLERQTETPTVETLAEGKPHAVSENPFTPGFDHPYGASGLQVPTAYHLLQNVFTIKFAGHWDAMQKQALHPILWRTVKQTLVRQFSHRLNRTFDDNFYENIQFCFRAMGVDIGKVPGSEELFLIPIASEDHAIIDLKKIQETVQRNLHLDSEKPDDQEAIDFVSKYLFEVLYQFQAHPGKSLGIGANWDHTVDYSTESNSQAFVLNPKYASWGQRFSQVSLARQSAEAKMDASIGFLYELGAQLTSFEFMTQLQETEYPSYLYNALVDNIVTDLFPEIAYHENPLYQKLNKHMVLRTSPEGIPSIEASYREALDGTFTQKAGDDKSPKQTPMFRHPATVQVESFPRDSQSGALQSMMSLGDPAALHAQQAQHLRARMQHVRGHYVYSPSDDDQFIEDQFYGQLLRVGESEYLPYIGVVPKNFDKAFDQDSELCASFVMRMLQSSHIMEFSPCFRDNYARFKAELLPPRGSKVPELPAELQHLAAYHRALQSAIEKTDRSTGVCEKALLGLFRNGVHALYPLFKADPHAHAFFLELMQSTDSIAAKRTQLEQLLRSLSVYRPLDSNGQKEFDAIHQYLKSLLTYYFPEPCDATAKLMADSARKWLESLLQHPDIKAYFVSLKANAQTNLSRKTTPGLASATFAEHGVSDLHSGYNAMRSKFAASYRSLSGFVFAEPQAVEILLDKVAKGIGAFLLGNHRLRIFALITAPINTMMVFGAKAFSVMRNYRRARYVAAVCAGLVGLFIGVFIGIVQTLDLFSRLFTTTPTNARTVDALRLSAAPSTEANPQTHLLNDLTQTLLALGQEQTPPAMGTWQNKLWDEFILPKLQDWHGHWLPKDADFLSQYKASILEEWPLTTDEWQILFKPLELTVVAEHKKLDNINKLLKRHARQINNDVLATIRLYLLEHPNPSYHHCKEWLKEKHLPDVQKDIILEFILQYRRLSDEEKRVFLAAIAPTGSLITHLNHKQKMLWQLCHWTADASNPFNIQEAIFARYVAAHQAKSDMVAQSEGSDLLHVLRQLPLRVRADFIDIAKMTETSASNKLQYEQYDSAEKEYILSLYKKFSNLPVSDQQNILDQLQHTADRYYQKHLQSPRDTNILKWLQHESSLMNAEFLPDASIKEFKEQMHAIIDTPTSTPGLFERRLALDHAGDEKSTAFSTQLNQMMGTYEALTLACRSEPHDIPQIKKYVDYFYKEINALINNLNRLILEGTADLTPQHIQELKNAIQALKDFRNINMHICLNKLFQLQNLRGPDPLANCEAIHGWLLNCYQENDLRNLFMAQGRMGFTVEETLWRSKWMIQGIEQSALAVVRKNTVAETMAELDKLNALPPVKPSRPSTTDETAMRHVTELPDAAAFTLSTVSPDDQVDDQLGTRSLAPTEKVQHGIIRKTGLQRLFRVLMQTEHDLHLSGEAKVSEHGSPVKVSKKMDDLVGDSPTMRYAWERAKGKVRKPKKS